MRSRAAAFPAAVVTAVLLTGCASARALSGSAISGTSHVTTAPSKRSAPPRASGPLRGKYQAIAMAFPDRRAGVAAVAGYPGQSTTVRSWIERTTDGGRSWTAGRPASGQRQPGAQYGFAFTSKRQGWAYGPDLFFTRDGGVTWRAERTPFPLTGPLAVAGTSTWVTGYGCTRGDCPAAIYATDRVGGALRRLPGQPRPTGSVVAMRRPTPAVAWLLLALRHGRTRLVTTRDAGRSWETRPLPCPGDERPGQLSAAGPGSLWLVCEGTPMAGSSPAVLYRTTDGARTWTRIAAADSLTVSAVSNRVAWAVESGAVNGIVRTTDGGHTWHTVLSRADTDVEAFVPEGPSAAQAVAGVFTANGERFVAYGTRDAGKHWRRAPLPT